MNASHTPELTRKAAKRPATPASAEPLIPPIHSTPSGGMTGATGTPTGMSGGISSRDLENTQGGSVKISGGVG